MDGRHIGDVVHANLGKDTERYLYFKDSGQTRKGALTFARLVSDMSRYRCKLMTAANNR